MQLVADMRAGNDFVRRMESLGLGADEEATRRGVQDILKKLTRCQPVERASASACISRCLTARAIFYLGQHPCWEPVTETTLSLIFFLVSQSVRFCLIANVEAARARACMGWQGRWDNPEGHMRCLFPWALRESIPLNMPAFPLLLLRCICDGFVRSKNWHMFKSESGAQAHLMLAQLIFEGHADVSLAAVTESSSASGSSHMRYVVGSLAPKGRITSSHIADASGSRKEDMEMNTISSTAASDKYPHGKDSNTDRTLELAKCLHMLEVARQLVPFNAYLLKARIFGLQIQIKLANFSLRSPCHHWKLKFPFSRRSSRQQGKGVLNVSRNSVKNQVIPHFKGNYWFYMVHAGLTMSLLFGNVRR